MKSRLAYYGFENRIAKCKNCGHTIQGFKRKSTGKNILQHRCISNDEKAKPIRKQNYSECFCGCKKAIARKEDEKILWWNFGMSGKMPSKYPKPFDLSKLKTKDYEDALKKVKELKP